MKAVLGSTLRTCTAACVCVLTIAACSDDDSRADSLPIPPADSGFTVQTSDFQAGPPVPVRPVLNPYDGDEKAIAEGRRYYIDMNCAGCHGAAGGGGIGPPFVDEAWIYGSAPQNIYQSIVQGRPEGMPAFGGRIPEEQLWMIIAYVRSVAKESGRGQSSDGSR